MTRPLDHECEARNILLSTRYRPLIHLFLSTRSPHMHHEEWHDPWSMDMDLLRDQWDTNHPVVRAVGRAVFDMSEAERQSVLRYLKTREWEIGKLMMLRNSEDESFWQAHPTSRKQYVQMGRVRRKRAWEDLYAERQLQVARRDDFLRQLKDFGLDELCQTSAEINS